MSISDWCSRPLQILLRKLIKADYCPFPLQFPSHKENSPTLIEEFLRKLHTAPDDRTNRCLQQPAKSAINCAAMTWSEQTGSVYCRERTRFVYESRQYSGPVLSDTRHTSFYSTVVAMFLFQSLYSTAVAILYSKTFILLYSTQS